MDESVEPAQAQWQARYAAARAALLDVGHLLAVQEQLAARAHDPVAILAGDAGVRSAQRVGVFAGSFNPLTRAHVGVAAAAGAYGPLDAVIWTCARVTVDKERVERASLVDRLVQLEAHHGQGHTGGVADALAVVDAGLYADQAAAFRALLSPTAELWLIVGFDKVLQIFDAHYYTDRDAALRRLFAAATLFVAPRDEHTVSDLSALLSGPENGLYARHVRFLPLPSALAHISSTTARTAARDPSSSGAAGTGAWLLAPEGAALAEVTGAYQAPMPRDGELIDRYGLRLAWLAALAAVPAERRDGVDLTRLVEAASAANERGALIRRWLRGQRWADGPTDVAQVIALGA